MVTYGPPAGVLTVWVVCVQVPTVPPSAGKTEEAGPEPASRDGVLQLEVAGCGAAVVDGVAVQERRAGRATDCKLSTFVGRVLSTRTLVTSAEVKVLPTLSVVITRRS